MHIHITSTLPSFATHDIGKLNGIRYTHTYNTVIQSYNTRKGGEKYLDRWMYVEAATLRIGLLCTYTPSKIISCKEGSLGDKVSEKE